MPGHLTSIAIGTALRTIAPVAALAIPAATWAAAPATDTALATPQQLDLEATALRLLASEPMQAEIKRVELLYASDPQGALPTGRATMRRAARSIAMAAIQYALGDTDRPAIFWGTNAPHDWFGMRVPGSGFGIDNPDNVYRKTMVDGASRYRIGGRIKQPGPAEMHFELRDSIPGTAAMAVEGGKQLGTLRSDTMQIAPDGSFEITLDDAPANGRPNHLQMPDHSEFLLIIRDLFTDWKTQNPEAMEITRVGGPLPSPAPSDDALARRAAGLLAQMAPYWLAYDNRFVFTRPANTVLVPRVRPGGRGFSTSGNFTLKPDEAWVVTLRPLGAVSLGFQLTDPWGVAYNYIDRTSSLNLAQAKPNADGSYTYVVSQRDPGVYNWLDPEGHSAGIYALRWQSLPEGTEPATAIKDARVVPLATLKQVLPAETKWVTLAERKVQQAERRASYMRRLSAD